MKKITKLTADGWMSAKYMCDKIDELVDAINEMQEAVQPKESNPLVFLRECETKARLEGKIEGVKESAKIYHSYQAGEIDSCTLALMGFLSRLKDELKKLNK